MSLSAWGVSSLAAVHHPPSPTAALRCGAGAEQVCCATWAPPEGVYSVRLGMLEARAKLHCCITWGPPDGDYSVHTEMCRRGSSCTTASHWALIPLEDVELGVTSDAGPHGPHMRGVAPSLLRWWRWEPTCTAASHGPLMRGLTESMMSCRGGNPRGSAVSPVLNLWGKFIPSWRVFGQSV